MPQNQAREASQNHQESSGEGNLGQRAGESDGAVLGARDTHQILFVSGKGGVGKSLIAASIALEEVRKGRRVLLVEIGDISYYKDFWNLPNVRYQPTRTVHGFDVALWSGDTALREYVLYYLKLEKIYSVFFENKVMRSLINVAPGLNEIAILGKITSGIRKVGPAMDYDLIVVDCYATGHALSLLQAPKGMMEAIQIGPMGHHSREIENVLRNPKICGYIVVTLLEEMPVVETLDFCRSLKAELGIDCQVIANRVLNVPVSREDLLKIESVDPAGMGEFAKYLVFIADRQGDFLQALRKEMSQIKCVPLIFSNDPDQLVVQAGEALRKA